MSDWFDILSRKRRNALDNLDEIGGITCLRQMSVEMYSESAHFVYELLQNAEDQDANEVCFTLMRDCLIFEHNGTPFTHADVKNIAALGNSGKQEQANKIGRFGIGFKSVYRVTERPEVFTTINGDPFSFAIENLIIPRCMELSLFIWEPGVTHASAAHR